MKTKRNDRQGRTSGAYAARGAFKAQKTHERKKAVGVGVTL